MWIGTKTYIPMPKVDETPGFIVMRDNLPFVDSDNSVRAADLSSLSLPDDLVCGGSYLVAVVVDEVRQELPFQVSKNLFYGTVLWDTTVI